MGYLGQGDNLFVMGLLSQIDGEEWSAQCCLLSPVEFAEMSQQSRTELEAESLLAIHQCQVTEIKKGSGWKAIMFTVFVRCGRSSPHVTRIFGKLHLKAERHQQTDKHKQDGGGSGLVWRCAFKSNYKLHKYCHLHTQPRGRQYCPYTLQILIYPLAVYKWWVVCRT